MRGSLDLRLQMRRSWHFSTRPPSPGDPHTMMSWCGRLFAGLWTAGEGVVDEGVLADPNIDDGVARTVRGLVGAGSGWAGGQEVSKEPRRDELRLLAERSSDALCACRGARTSVPGAPTGVDPVGQRTGVVNAGRIEGRLDDRYPAQGHNERNGERHKGPPTMGCHASVTLNSPTLCRRRPGAPD